MPRVRPGLRRRGIGRRHGERNGRQRGHGGYGHGRRLRRELGAHEPGVGQRVVGHVHLHHGRRERIGDDGRHDGTGHHVHHGARHHVHHGARHHVHDGARHHVHHGTRHHVHHGTRHHVHHGGLFGGQRHDDGRDDGGRRNPRGLRRALQNGLGLQSERRPYVLQGRAVQGYLPHRVQERPVDLPGRHGLRARLLPREVRRQRCRLRLVADRRLHLPAQGHGQEHPLRERLKGRSIPVPHTFRPWCADFR
ncbi:MAG: hypothetical protein D6705_08780 [Deltaproteobacteria bacterium]|nr:MAG: hypothetical protein D6705_08780 [Deltaproteobacteria bacterium]